MSESSLGVALVLELVREAARTRRCARCGAVLEDAEIDARTVDVERIVVELRCGCGTTETVEVSPAGDGVASIA